MMLTNKVFLTFAFVVCLLAFLIGANYVITNPNGYGLFYLLLIPLGWATSIMDTRRTIKTQSAKGRSLTAYGIAWILLTNALIRVIVVGDFLLILNTLVFVLLNGYQFYVFIKLRRT